MTEQNNLIEQAERIKDLVFELNRIGKPFVQDKSVPLKIRWETFLECGLGGTGVWIVYFKSLEGKFPEGYPISYEGLNRGTTIKIENLDEQLIDRLGMNWVSDYPEETNNDYYKGAVPLTSEEKNKLFADLLEGRHNNKHPQFAIFSPRKDRNGKHKWAEGCIKEDLVPRLVEFTQADYDAWREEVLEMYIKSYDYDW